MRLKAFAGALVGVFTVCVLAFVCSASDKLIGDIDADGVVTFDDAQLIFDYVAGTAAFSLEQISNADIDGDGRVTVADAVQVFHYVSGTLSDIPYVQRTGGVLTVLTLPEKINYFVGDSLDLSGIRVVLTYSDGTYQEVSGYSVSGYEPTAGTKIIIISYDGKKTAFTVTVYPKNIVDIEITTLPDKLNYNSGDVLDLTGLTVTAYYDDGTYSVIRDYAVSGFTGDSGVNTVKLQYMNYTLQFEVTVGG